MGLDVFVDATLHLKVELEKGTAEILVGGLAEIVG